MKQVLQNLGSGETVLAEVPVPAVRAGCLLIQTQASLISLGTEKMLLDFGRANLIEKARQQPEKVKQVLDKVKTDGVAATVQAVRSKLDQPIALGYCNAGEVMEVGEGVQNFRVGDRVASNGPHAEFICVPENPCAVIPDEVGYADAAFTVAGAVSLQSIRLLKPTLGECVVVMGLGLMGLMAVQLLRASGCRVLGVDLDSQKCALAGEFGAEVVDLSQNQDPLNAADVFSRGSGVDAVLIAATTKSEELMHQAAQICRKRGRIILLGVVGLNLKREDFYEKELRFQVSCSYGPGRYDENYEQKGQDYPIGFVRWTEQRNFEAVLDMFKAGALRVLPLISHRFPFDGALEAYDVLTKERATGILLEYSREPAPEGVRQTVVLPKSPPAAKPEVVIGMIGAGNYARAVLLPALALTGVRLHTIVSGQGVSGTHLGKKFGFEQSSTDPEAIFKEPEINTVIICTRHNTHAQYLVRALEAGKRVFVEKPLCLSFDELDAIEKTYHAQEHPFLMLGFNRRFSPFSRKIKALLDQVEEPKSFMMTVNAGFLPADNWNHDPKIGGGRIIGEACHFIDFLRFLTGHSIKSLKLDCLESQTGRLRDVVTINLGFADGSIASIHYWANGDKSFPKERLEVFAGGRILQLDNFRALKAYAWPGFRKSSTSSQDKGHKEAFSAFVSAVQKGEASPIPFEEILEVSRFTLEAAELARSKP